MITLTNNAHRYLRQQIQKERGVAFRLGIKESGCSGLRYLPEIISKIDTKDLCIEQNDVTICLDPKYVDTVRDLEIDYITKSLGQQQIVFNNPNSTGDCGCGESFSVKPIANQDEV